MNLCLWKSFPGLVRAVKADYIARGAVGGGHDFYHALMVAQYAELIAEDPETATLGWITGLLHNTDRMYPKEKVIPVLTRHLQMVRLNIPSGHLCILRAVLEHTKRNDPADSPLLMTLKDADRLANIGAWHFLRAAQFRPTILAVDPRFIVKQDPTATFKDPKSVLGDIEHTLEWESWLRLPKTQELGKPMFDEIRRLVANIESQFETLGLLSFPDELVVEPQNERRFD